jgi:hypothetical protein
MKISEAPLVRNVIHKDRPVRDAEKQIEPGIARVCRENSFGVHTGQGVVRIKSEVIGNRKAATSATPIDFT